jgi:phosphohistidine phosphatase SixA
MVFYKAFDGQRNLPILCVILLLSSFSTIANNYNIYLVRHAEKLNDSKDPTLTKCGKARAEQLATLLSKTNIKHIYSTHYQRTMQTAKPLADQQQLAIKNYNPRYLGQLSLKLQQQKANTLVVGHSNTTPELVRLLTEEIVTPLSEKDYQQLYQIQYIDEQTVLTIFQQPLSCHNTSV